MFEQKDRAALKTVVEGYASLLSAVAEQVGERPMVLPTAEFFPDRFTPDEGSASRLVARMMTHAGLDDVPLTTRVVDDPEAESPHAGGCASGCAVPLEKGSAVPRLQDDGNGFFLNVLAPELGHPVVLTTMVARALGHVLLVESLPGGASFPVPAELLADYAAVALGFGPLLMEGAYIYSSGCGGPRVGSVTRAGLEELAVLTALFIEMKGYNARRATKELGATQADALGKGLEWARSNPELCLRLKREPERVAAGDYSLEEAKPWLLRVFAKRKSREDEPPKDLFVHQRRAPKPRDPVEDELSNLVGEALRSSRADAE